MSFTKSNRTFYIGIALAVMTTIIWSGNYVIARGISSQLPAVSLAFYRWATASVCIAPFAWKKFTQERRVIDQHKSYIFWTALTGVSLFNTFIYFAGHYSSAINLALIGTTSAPVFATFLAALFLRERAGLLTLIGMVCCILGILFLISGGDFEQLKQFRFGKGDLLMLISAFLFAIYTILVRKKPAAISPLVFLFVIFSLGTVCLLPFYLYEILHSPAVSWTPGMLLIILYLGIGNSIIAFFCWNSAIARLGASGTALFGNLIPVFSTIEAVLFLGEAFSRIHLISGALVVGGLIIANLKKPVGIKVN